MPIFAEYKKAGLKYEILDTFEAGIELLGTEVKSLRAHRGTLDGAFVLVRGGEAFVTGLSIPPFQAKNAPEGYDAERTRRLLLTKKELRELVGRTAEKGLTIVPLSVYNKGTVLKLRIALVRGKKKHDKRETLKKRTMMREAEREARE